MAPFTPEVREALYKVAAALAPLVVAAGFISEDVSKLLLGLVGAVLTLVGALAAVNTPTTRKVERWKAKAAALDVAEAELAEATDQPPGTGGATSAGWRTS